MSERPAATEIVFLPGFDAAAELRAEFLTALREPMAAFFQEAGPRYARP